MRNADHAPPKITDKEEDRVIQLRIHVVKENGPLLISRDPLANLKATLNSIDSALAVKNQLEIQLDRTPSGHLMLHGIRETKPAIARPAKHDHILGEQVYAAALDVPMPELSKEDVGKWHLALRHCPEHTLITMLRAAHLAAQTAAIEEMYKECNCQAGVHRVAAPNVS